MSTTGNLPPGSDLGPYRIVAPLGAGGMGEVYRAADPRLEREVALKVLPAELAEDPERLGRFQREAKSLAALSHPNVVTIHEVGEAGGVPFLAMELVEGETLDRSIPAGGMELEAFLDLAIPLADALASAHERGVIHRDLKPGNVMVGSGGRLKVLDFGLARREPRGMVGGVTDLPTATLEDVTREGTILGTAPYMSPEQVQGLPTDPRSDIFSLGIVLHQMLTGELPFAGENPASLASSILRDDPEPVDRLRPGLPRHLGRVLGRCLEKDPKDRYQTARDVCNELRGLREEVASEARLGGSSAGATRGLEWTARLRRPSVLAGAAALLGALILLAGLFLFRPGGAEPPATTAGVIDSLAVLPLANLSGDPEQEYFADGMTDALITDLSKIEALKVISRTSVMRFKGDSAPLPEIARELGVEAVVEGSVLREARRVRITAQLIDARTDQHLWAGSYERELRDVLSLQAQVARAIAEEVQLTLTPEVEARLTEAPTVDPEAHEAYLQGRQLWQRWLEGPTDLEQAIPHFLRAIELDPGYALAHAGLADTYLVLAHFARPAGEAMPLARRSALEALELDPALAEAHASLADSVFHYEWDWARAESEFRRALELNPGYSIGHWWYSGFLAAMGRHEEAIREIRRAQELDPLSYHVNAFAIRVLHWARRPDEVLEEASRVRERFPENDPGPYAMALAQKGRTVPPEIVAQLETSAATVAAPFPRTVLAVTLAATGREVTSRRLLEELDGTYRQSHTSPYLIALAYSLLDERNKALDWLEEAYETRAAELIWIAVEPGFDRLRDEPRFREIVEAMEFPERVAARS